MTTSKEEIRLMMDMFKKKAEKEKRRKKKKIVKPLSKLDIEWNRLNSLNNKVGEE